MPPLPEQSDRVRTFVCRSCGLERAASTSTGPLPSVCATCDPVRAAERDAIRVAARLRAQRQAHDAGAARALRERPQLGPPSRQTVALAVRQVADARGARATSSALLDLAAAALAWSDALQMPTNGQATKAEA